MPKNKAIKNNYLKTPFLRGVKKYDKIENWSVFFSDERALLLAPLKVNGRLNEQAASFTYMNLAEG